MQCKKLEKLTPVQPGRKAEYLITVQKTENILLLDVFKNNSFRGRQAMDCRTGEYMQYDLDDGKWRQRKFGNLLDLDVSPNGYFSSDRAYSRMVFDTVEMEKTVAEGMGEMKISHRGIFWKIYDAEQEYAQKKRIRIEDNRVMRVQDKMRLVPPVPEKARQWIWQAEGAEDYAFRDQQQCWHCTACGSSLQSRYLHREDGDKKVRHNDRVVCTECGKTLTAKTRTNRIGRKSQLYLAQRMDDRMAVWRCFDVTMEWTADGRKILLSEGVRIILYSLTTGSKYAGEIFYNQYTTKGAWTAAKGWNPEYAYFDNKKNPSNRRQDKGYLYPEGIDNALAGTSYQGWGRLMGQLAEAGIKLNYNNLLSTQEAPRAVGLIEYLFKGRFYRLLEDTAEDIYPATAAYFGPLNISGDSVPEIFGIRDKQRINLIRDINGGDRTLEWMRHSDKTGVKINGETLQWLENNRVDPENVKFIENRMTIRQIMNYVKRQQAEEYPGKTAKAVIGQWKDYLDMLARLGKKADDEMMYRPRQLKRRHDECVDEINARRIREEMKRSARERARKAREMRQRFPGAEENLEEIRPKYEYRDEEYIITVPRKLTDIILEGQALHHCAGATDRYFDRIMQRETYICFLRRASDPETPYYTIEVEPGGTIRQHRGMYDEEPNIEQIKPFLRKWQKEIHKRMTREDKEHAAASAVKRRQNIEELKAARNTRVLQGLMEDFMPGENENEESGKGISEEALTAAGA